MVDVDKSGNISRVVKPFFIEFHIMRINYHIGVTLL